MGIVIGIDIGTGSTEADIVDRSTGELIGNFEVEYRPGFTVPKEYPNGADSDPETWLAAVESVLSSSMSLLRKKALDKEVEGVGISGLYGGLGVPLDQEGEVIRPAMIWLDQRAGPEAELIRKWEIDEAIEEVTGQSAVHPYYGYIKLVHYAMRETGRFLRTKYLLPPCGYVIMKLTGEKVTDTSSFGNLGGFFDIRRYEYSEETAFLLGENISRELGRQISFPSSLFGRMVEPTEAVGGFSQEAAGKTGVPKGTPVFCAGVDAAVSLLASGVAEPGENGLMLGTSWCWGVLSEREKGNFPRGLVNFPFVVDSKRLLYSFGGGAYPGGAVDPWFKEIAGLPLSEMEAEAEKVPPGCDGLLFHPHLMGERCPVWNENVRGSFVGLGASMGRGHLYRAVLEGGAYLHRWNMESALEAGVEVKGDTTLIDGGAKSTLWRGILADVCQRRLRFLEDFHKTPFGTAMVAAVGLGTPIKEVVGWAGNKVDILPDPDKKEIYDKAFERFRRLYYVLESFYDPKAASDRVRGDSKREKKTKEHKVRYIGGRGGKKEKKENPGIG